MLGVLLLYTSFDSVWCVSKWEWDWGQSMQFRYDGLCSKIHVTTRTEDKLEIRSIQKGKKSSLWFNPWTEHYLGFFLCAWTGHGLMTSKCAKTHTMFAQCSLLQVWHMIEIFELWYFKVPDWFLKALESKLYQIALLLMQYVTASSKQFLQRELHFYKFLPSM